MKKLILFTLLCLPLITMAQTNAKYLEGAITLNDEKRVSFKTEINAPSLTKQQIYSTMLEWANNRFQPEGKLNARVLYANETDGRIAAGGEEYIVFANNAISLDRTRIYYLLDIACKEGKCIAEMTRIRYWYEENRDGGEKYAAEGWITDDMALNKSKTKLAPVAGKFRRETINLKDELFKSIQQSLANLVAGKTLASQTPEPEKPAEEMASANTVITLTTSTGTAASNATPVAPVAEAPKPVTAPAPKNEAQDGETLIRSAVRMTITAGNDEQFEISKECWGGFGELFGKHVVFCLIDTQKTMGNLLLTQSDTYTISFYQAGNNTPSVVVKCKKLMAQTITGEEAQKMNAASDKQKSYNMYVGEVIK